MHFTSPFLQFISPGMQLAVSGIVFYFFENYTVEK